MCWYTICKKTNSIDTKYWPYLFPQWHNNRNAYAWWNGGMSLHIITHVVPYLHSIMHMHFYCYLSSGSAYLLDRESEWCYSEIMATWGRWSHFQGDQIPRLHRIYILLWSQWGHILKYMSTNKRRQKKKNKIKIIIRPMPHFFALFFK